MGRYSQAKKRLKRIFGNIDMFTEANIEQELELLKIKGYKIFEETQRLRGRPISQQLTFHHLRHKSEGGNESVKNGALIGASHHEYLHSLTREQEEVANNLIQSWKISFLIMTGQGEVLNSNSLKSSAFSDYVEIPLESDKKYKAHKHLSRARQKQITKQLIREYDYEEDEFEI